jgi:hypothetical protein
MISVNKELQLICEHIQALGSEDVELISTVNRIKACDLPGLVNSPSLDVSLKGGYDFHPVGIVEAST